MMERFLQYLDDLDDLYGMAGLAVERLRRGVIAICSWFVALFAAVIGISIALISPPLALATSILLFVTLLYRSVTSAHAFTPSA